MPWSRAPRTRTSRSLQGRVGGQVTGEVLAQRVPQPLEGAGPLPDQGLVGAGDNLHGLGPLAVARDQAQLGTVDADQPGGGEPAARSVPDLDIVMVLSPVVADELNPLLQPLDELVRAAGGRQLAP